MHSLPRRKRKDLQHIYKGEVFMYKTIDLFAGAGGLSLGFERTGKFRILAAFEKKPDMQETYRQNHKSTEMFCDVKEADYAALQRKYGLIDVVIGGPPCQGFSNANRQKNHLISQNNMLVKEFIRAVAELKPKAFVMENVRMLQSSVHRFYMTPEYEEIVKRYDIACKNTMIALLHGAEKEFMFDGVENCVQDQAVIKQLRWEEKDFAELNVVYKTFKNGPKMIKTLQKHRKGLLAAAEKQRAEGIGPIGQASNRAFRALKDWFAGKITLDALKSAVRPAVVYQKMLCTAAEIFEGGLLVERYDMSDGLHADVRTFSICDYIQSILTSDELGYQLQQKVLCAADFGVPQKRQRFIVMGVRQDVADHFSLPKGTYSPERYNTVRDAIEDLEDVPVITDRRADVGTELPDIVPRSKLGRMLRDSRVLKNHIVTKTTDTAMDRFKALHQGQNFHDLDTALKTTYTDVSRTQNTIYLRLEYDKPSGTVVNVRKSMWIHPTLDRAVSVREAARLQSFPDSFVFYGTKDMQYQQVGNAVPPLMAQAIAEDLAGILDAYEEKKKHGG